MIIDATVHRKQPTETQLGGLYIVVFGTGLLIAPLISALVASSAFGLPGPSAYGASLLAYTGFALACMMSANSNLSPFAFWLFAVPFCYLTFTMLSFLVFLLDKKDSHGVVINVERLAKSAIATTGILVAINPYSYLVFKPPL